MSLTCTGISSIGFSENSSTCASSSRAGCQARVRQQGSGAKRRIAAASQLQLSSATQAATQPLHLAELVQLPRTRKGDGQALAARAAAAAQHVADAAQVHILAGGAVQRQDRVCLMLGEAGLEGRAATGGQARGKHRFRRRQQEVQRHGPPASVRVLRGEWLPATYQPKHQPTFRVGRS